MLQSTLVLLKPDALHRGLIGTILTRFEQLGLQISALKLVYPTKEQAADHYFDLADRLTPTLGRLEAEKTKSAMVDFLVSSPLVALCLTGVEAIEVVRSRIGATEPKSALPGTIRGDFAHVSYGHARDYGLPVCNLVHASDSPANAIRELSLWFSLGELFTYTSHHTQSTIYSSPIKYT